MIIATQKKKKKDTSNEKDNGTWLKNTEETKAIKKAWDDGYQVGDITKTILGARNIAKNAMADTATQIGKGFMSTIEGTVDAARYGIGSLVEKSAEGQATIWELFGNDEYAKGLKKAGQDVKEFEKQNAQYDVTANLLGEQNDIFKTNWSEKINQNSILGTKSQGVAQGIGNVGAFVGMSGISPMLGGGELGAFGQFVNSFSSAYGNTRNEAYKNGADDKTANRAGWIGGLAEGISEQFFSGIPGMKTAGWGDVLNSRLSESVAKFFGSNAGKVALTFFDGVGEGSEEIISNIFNAIGTDVMHYLDENYTYGMENMSGNVLKDVKDSAFSQDSLDSFVSAMLTSVLTGGGKQLTQNVIQSNASNRIANQSDISKQQATELINQIAEKRANLELDEDANFKEKTEAIDNEKNKLAKEIKQAVKEGQQVDLNELLEQTPNSKQEVQFALNQDEFKNIKSDKQKVLANDMARLNNVKENHNLFKVVNAIQSANNTQQYHITTTEGLYDMGIVNKDENGNYTMPDGSPYVPRGLNYKNGEIYINADVGSQSGTQAVYHEMFEGFKKASPEQYNEFKQMVTDIIGEENIQKEFDTYKAMYGEELTDDIRDEIINDKFGELAENQDFINKIADNRNVLEKFIDSIKNMIKYVKGTDEERQLMKLQKNLEKEFAKRYKETDFSQNKGETAYSLKDQQNEIIQKSNPRDTSLGEHTWINSADDIKTFEEALQADEYESGNLTPDFTNKMVEDALKTGKMTVYSSYPIKNGTFVTPSKMEAQSYAGNQNVYSKEVNLNDIAWIDSLQGQYAKVETDTKYSLSKDNNGRELSEGQRDYFKDSKAVDDDGNLVTVYHTTTDETIQFNEFDPVGTPYYKFGEQVVNYFTDSKEMSGSYADQYYEMADTKKLNSIDEARQWLSSINEDLSLENNNIYWDNIEPEIKYDNEEQLLRNLKSDIQRLVGEEAKLQYQGYVNITNPYVIDAEGRYWNKVESKGDTEITKKLIRIPSDVKEYLNTLASDSIHTFNENLFNWEQADRAVRDFASDRKNTTLEQRMLNRSIHEMEYETFMKVLDGNGRWGENVKFMDVLYNNDLITPTEKQQFDKSDGTIPTEIRDKIREKINEPVKYEDGFIKRELEVLGIPAEIKETTLNDLWRTRDEAYKTFDEGGRTEDVKFINTMLAQESEYSKYGVDVDTLFDTAKHKFTDDYIRDRHNDWSVTNDIVKKIIDLNGYGENYDGVIMKNVVDYGGDAENKAPHDLYITFNSNQFKAVDNLNPTEDADIRYSMTSNENIEAKDAPITQQEIAPIRQDLSKITEQMNNLSNQIETLQNELETKSEGTPKGYVETFNEQRNENIPTRATTEEEANTLQDALMQDEGYLKSLDEQANLESENTKLIKQLTDNVSERLGLGKNQKNTLNNIIKNAIDNQYTTDEIANELSKEFSQIKYEYPNEDAIELRKAIRAIPLLVSNEIKNDIADYGSFKNSNFGKIKFSNKGIPVDTAYAELSNKYPGYFPTDIVNPTDQLLKISDVVNLATKSVETIDIDADEIDNIADYIKNTVLNDEYTSLIESQASLDKDIEFNFIDDIAPTTIRTQESIDDYIENRDIAPIREDSTNRKPKSPISERLDTIKRRLDTIKRRFGEMITNRNYEIDKLSKATGNKDIKFAGDMLNSVSGEVQYNINNKQTDINGNTIGKSVAEIFEPSKKSGLYEVFNDYLFHKSNIERHKVGKGSQVPAIISEQLVKQYDNKYPELQEWSKDVYKYYDNVLQEQVDAGLITQEQYDNYRGEQGIYRSYTPFYEGDIDNNRYFDKDGNVKPVSTLKKSKGNASDVNQLLSMEDAMAKQTYAYKRAIRKNELYKQIVSSLDKYTDAMDIDVRDNPNNLNDSLFVTPEGDKVLSAYINGEKVSAQISDELYNELSQENENRIKQLEEDFSLITKPLQKVSGVRRNILTTWNLTFLARNAKKDIQDAVINSKHTGDMLKNYFGLKKGQKSAIFELRDAKTKEAQQFLALYGAENLYGDYSKKGNKFTRANELIELAPRFAEFKASLQNGESVQEAIYNAREVTTNFGRGGYITKALNRNGFTFLNANVQGLDKLVRNLSGENGVKGVTSVVVKGAAFAMLPSIINELLYGFGDDKDEEYEALPDYIKDNYYLIKTEGNNFVRIPKGRINAAFGSLARRTINAIEGDENSYEGWTKNAWDQIGVGDLGSNNILAPITQAFGSPNGEAWYGGDIVPTRLQNKPAAEQTDAKIDAISNWVGETFNVSPYKVNYVLDQYSGGIGDILLPMITPETKSGAEKPHEYLLAPIKDTFVVNSTDDNKYAGEFYNTKDKVEIQSNSQYATDEDILRYKYMSNVSKQMSELYKERREVQADTTLGNKEKYAKVQAIQNEINNLAKEAMQNYKNFGLTDNYSNINGTEYYKDSEGEWNKVKEDESEFTSGLNDSEKTSYYSTKNKISAITKEYTAKTKELDKDDPLKKQYSAEKRENITRAITNSGLDNYTKAMIYSKYYSDKDNMTNAVNAGYNIDTYITALNDIDILRDKYSQNNGYTTEQRKQKTLAYINSLDMNIPQKAMLIRQYYSSFREYNTDIVNYVSSLNIPYEERIEILKGTGMTVKGNQVTWK